MPKQHWPWDKPRERSPDEIREDNRRQRRHLSRLLQERLDELTATSSRAEWEREARTATRKWLDDQEKNPDPADTLSSRLDKLRPILYNDSRMDERNMAFPVYNSQHERSLLEALSVTSVSLQYDTTTPAPDLSPNSFDYRDDAATFTGVAITVAGTLTDKQARLLTKWAQDRFGPTYERSQPRLSVAPVTPAPAREVPVTFTERPAAK